MMMWFLSAKHRATVHPVFILRDEDGFSSHRAYHDLTNTQHLPHSIFCPIMHAPMQDPVIAADGFSYEREALERWFEKRSISPMTRQKIPTAMISNHTLRNTVTELVEAECNPPSHNTGVGGRDSGASESLSSM